MLTYKFSAAIVDPQNCACGHAWDRPGPGMGQASESPSTTFFLYSTPLHDKDRTILFLDLFSYVRHRENQLVS
jgi:hypothetical protein